MTGKPEPLPASARLPGLMTELGVKRATAEALMRRLPKVEIEGVLKVYVRRADF